MTKFCGSCHSPNVDSAKYCRGCGGKFSGVVSDTTVFHVLGKQPRAAGKAAKAVRAGEGGVPIVWAGIVTMVAVLVGAFAMESLTRAVPSREATDVAQAQTQTPTQAKAHEPSQPELQAKDKPVPAAPLAASAPTSVPAPVRPTQPTQVQGHPPARPVAVAKSEAAAPPAPEPEPEAAAPKPRAVRASRPAPAPASMRAASDATPVAPAIQSAAVRTAPRPSPASCGGGDTLCVPMASVARPAAPVVPIEARQADSASASSEGQGVQRVIMFKGAPVFVNVGEGAVQ